MPGPKPITETVRRIFSGLKFAFGLEGDQYQEVLGRAAFKGEVFLAVHDAASGQVLEERHIPNVVTKDLSILLARLCAGSSVQGGITALALGSGDPAWDSMPAPPLPGEGQRSLQNEIFRKPIHEVRFIDAGGNDTGGRPAHVVDFTTIFGASEAAAPLREMGLLGGDADPVYPPSSPPVGNGEDHDTFDVRGYDTLCNYLTFPVIHKPASATLTLTWRLTF